MLLPTRTSRERLWLVLGGVAALALIAITYVVFRGHSGHSAQSKIRSLAAPPLSNLSGDSTQEYLADGMTEERADAWPESMNCSVPFPGPR